MKPIFFIKRKLKTTSGLMSITLIVLGLVLGVSYSTFIITTEKYKASEMLVSTLTYGISIARDTSTSSGSISGRTVTLTSIGYSIYDITITSLNEINSNYSLEYRVLSGSGRVVYLGTTSYNPTGSINKNGTSVYTKTIKVGVERTSSNNMQVEFNVSGGYTYNSTPGTLTGYNKISTKGHRVEVSSNNTSYGTVTYGSQIINNNGTATITLNPKTGYEYSSNTCGGTISGNILIIKNITSAKTCSVTFTKVIPTLYAKIIEDNPTVLERTSFTSTLGTSTATTDTIYKASGNYTEDGSDVYYFAGNVSNNWVKFGQDENNNDLYWRIIRTNEDGGVRLLYAGTSPDTTTGYIGKSTYNSSYNNTMYVGWMYGTEGSLENNRLNTNSSNAKTAIDTWYSRGLNTKTDTSGNKYDSYISKTTIYCNDRSGDSYASSVYYGSYNRLRSNKSPSYACGMKPDKSGLYSDASDSDKFTVSKTTGNGDLTYPVSLMTADEVAMAGGKYESNNSYAYYYLNSANGSVTGNSGWWTMSPAFFLNGSASVMFVYGSSLPGRLNYNAVSNIPGLRPVVSLKSCTRVTEGNGAWNTPYEISIDSACASKEN